MDAPLAFVSAHPQGELKIPLKPPLDTPCGRFHAVWDNQAPVTREGQLILFFQFLQAGGGRANFFL